MQNQSTISEKDKLYAILSKRVEISKEEKSKLLNKISNTSERNKVENYIKNYVDILNKNLIHMQTFGKSCIEDEISKLDEAEESLFKNTDPNLLNTSIEDLIKFLKLQLQNQENNDEIDRENIFKIKNFFFTLKKFYDSTKMRKREFLGNNDKNSVSSNRGNNQLINKTYTNNIANYAHIDINGKDNYKVNLQNLNNEQMNKKEERAIESTNFSIIGKNNTNSNINFFNNIHIINNKNNVNGTPSFFHPANPVDVNKRNLLMKNHHPVDPKQLYTSPSPIQQFNKCKIKHKTPLNSTERKMPWKP